MVEHSTHHPKVKGLRPATDDGTERYKIAKKHSGYCVVDTRGLLFVCERLMDELDTSCERDRSFLVFSVISEQARLELGMKFVGQVLSSCLTMNSSEKFCSRVGTSWE